MNDKDRDLNAGVSRREFVGITMAGAAATIPAFGEDAAAPAATVSFAFSVNGQRHEFNVDPRVTLLDLLREDLKLTGTKKGCDHGQCGACTVLVNGERKNSCLMLGVMQDGKEITTIEGLASGGQLHPMQQAFIDYDGFQCGYCTPGQICSAVALLSEVRQGAPSYVTQNVAQLAPVELTDDEIRERMSGNICRCGAYRGILEAIRQVHGGAKA